MSSAEVSLPRTSGAIARHRFIDRGNELKGIQRDDVNALIWRRRQDTPIRGQAEALARNAAGMVLDTCCRPDQVRESLLDAIRLRPLQIDRIVDDLEQLTHNFAVVARSVSVRVQLEVVAEQPCPLFHVDSNVLRMICSYTGPGTQYADDRYRRRERLRCGDNPGVLGGQVPVTLEPGDIILMRGERCPGTYGRGAVHRSPPMTDGQRRLLLRLDLP
jgi:hypothetical protein